MDFFIRTFSVFVDVSQHALFKAVVASILGIINFTFGCPTVGFLALVVVYSIDFLLGTYISLRNGGYSYQKFRGGLFKFILYCLAIILSNMVDVIIAGGEISFGFKYIIISYIGVHEAISAYKKLDHLGFKIPDRFFEMLNGYKNKIENISLDTNKKEKGKS